MVKITKRFVDGLPALEAEQVFWDDEMPGFGLRVKAGNDPTKSYVVQYRNAAGRSRRKTLGRHGDITPDQARKLARDVKHDVAKGTDPVAERAAWRAAPTVDDLMDEYVSSHVENHNKPSTQGEFKRLIDRHIRPALGKLKAQDVSRHEVAKLHKAMRDTPRQANVVLSVLSKAFNLAETWGFRPQGTNPTRQIVRYKERTRDRRLTQEDLRKLGKAFENAETKNTIPLGLVPLFRLLAFSGCRLSEIINLTWPEVDFVAGTLNLRDAKAGARSHVLSALALDLLAGQQRSDDCEFVFPSGAGTAFDRANVERAWRKLRKAADLEDLRIHDLRHMVGTMAGATGANAFQIRDLLGHKTLAVTARYVARDDDPVRSIQDRVSAQIEAGLSGASKGVITPIKRLG